MMELRQKLIKILFFTYYRAGDLVFYFTQLFSSSFIAFDLLDGELVLHLQINFLLSSFLGCRQQARHSCSLHFHISDSL
jgi:hypothetical protein